MQDAAEGERKALISSSSSSKLDVHVEDESKEETVEIEWRIFHYWSAALYNLLSILSIGTIPIFCFFFPTLKLQMKTIKCSPDEAELVLLTLDGVDYIASVDHFECCVNSTEHVVSFEAKCRRFTASSKDNFELCAVPDVPHNFKRFLGERFVEGGGGGGVGGSDKLARVEERNILLAHYGKNGMYLPETSALEILVRHALSPFFLFQYFAVTIWLIEGYYVYSVLIFIITVVAIYFTVSESIFNLERLRALAGKESFVRLLEERDDGGEFDVTTLSDTVLVPGDRFLVLEGEAMPCDAILLSGRVVVDESMLTGECIPVGKTPIELSGLSGPLGTACVTSGSLAFLPKKSQKNMEPLPTDEVDYAAKRSGSVLFGGTKIKACHGGQCIAVCYRTGFRSAKGQLIASLLSPREAFMNFISDALWVVLFMLILTTLLYIYIAYQLKSMGATDGEVALHYFDAITIAVPPALTASLSVATAISIGRLKDQDIFVSDTSAVNLAGVISAACFDKTGTLTEERMDFQGSFALDKNKAAFVETGSSTSELSDLCLEVMSCCQSLSLLEDSVQPVGDVLEVELLRASQWSLEMAKDGSGKMSATPPKGTQKYHILRHFEFTPERLRAASLLQRPNGEVAYIIKGSPEVIISISRKDTVPSNVAAKLTELAKRGLRVIAFAHRPCSERKEQLEGLSQDQLEGLGDIQFLGLLFLSSRLKAETRSTIATLAAADINANMITGDHIHTAIAVATDCGILMPSTATTNVLYIVDENPADGSTIIMDSHSDSLVHDMKMSVLLDMAAKSSNILPTKILNDYDFGPGFVVPASHTDSTHHIQIAITGRGLVSVAKNYDPETVQALVRYARVFARTKPTDKKYVVDVLMQTPEFDERLQALILYGTSSKGSIIQKNTDNEDLGLDDDEKSRGNYSVLFCGDGANDMAALRAANVGVSLCDAETSVAAPVTSKMQNPGSVIEVLQEGRCSLITAYVLVLYMIEYGVIQLFMACELYNYGLVAGDYMYLIQDLFFTLVLGLAIAFTPKVDELSWELPPKRFLTRWLLFKLVLQVLCFVFFQIFSLYILSLQSWYTEYTTDVPLVDTYSWEATVVSNVALGQLMIASVTSTIGAPFRQPWYTNHLHTGALLLQAVWVLYQIFAEQGDAWAEDYLQLKPIPFSFGIILVTIIMANAVVSTGLFFFAECFRPRPKRKFGGAIKLLEAAASAAAEERLEIVANRKKETPNEAATV